MYVNEATKGFYTCILACSLLGQGLVPPIVSPCLGYSSSCHLRFLFLQYIALNFSQNDKGAYDTPPNCVFF